MSRVRRQWGEDDTVRLDLSAGATVSVTFRGNMFDLSTEESELIAALTGVIQRYRDAAALTEAGKNGDKA